MCKNVHSFFFFVIVFMPLKTLCKKMHRLLSDHHIYLTLLGCVYEKIWVLSGFVLRSQKDLFSVPNCI